jgi:Uncharacterized protein conserved in bacteria
MIEAIKRFYETRMSPNDIAADDSLQHRLQLATAALLIEMAQADNQRHSMEFQAVHDGIMEVFDLSPEETAEVIELADEEAHDATDHFEFTELINQQFDHAQKFRSWSCFGACVWLIARWTATRSSWCARLPSCCISSIATLLPPNSRCSATIVSANQ